MNKMIAFLVVLISVMSLCSCSSGDIQPTEAPTQKPTEIVTQPPTQEPTEEPTQAPTQAPTELPQEVTTVFATMSSSRIESGTRSFSTGDLTLITGTWTLDYYETADKNKTKPKTDISYTFKEDGTFSVSVNGNVATGIFVFDGSKISYTADASGEKGEFTYDSSAKTLNDIDSTGGTTAVMIKKG